jgi:cation/acetate symporter
VTRPLADCQWFGVDAIAAGVFGVPVGVTVMVLVSLLTARPPQQQGAVIDGMRFPAHQEH